MPEKRPRSTFGISAGGIKLGAITRLFKGSSKCGLRRRTSRRMSLIDIQINQISPI